MEVQKVILWRHKMKKFLSLLFAVCMFFAFVGCGGGKDNEQEIPKEELFRIVREEF